jgi:hypothetical protein
VFTAVVRISGAGRIEEFRERLRWLMVRDEDPEDYTEHHAGGVLEYRFAPQRGIPFPAFTLASVDFPELRVEAEWERDGARGRAVIENGRLVETAAAASDEVQAEVRAAEDGRLEFGVTCRPDAGGGLIGYAVTDSRHTYFRFREGRLELLDPDSAPDAALEDAAFRFVDEWIWYDEEDAPLERTRYANYGYPVRGANLKAEKLALLRANDGRYSTMRNEEKLVVDTIVAQWLNK